MIVPPDIKPLDSKYDFLLRSTYTILKQVIKKFTYIINICSYFHSFTQLTFTLSGLISSIASHFIGPLVSGISSKYNNGSPIIIQFK